MGIQIIIDEFTNPTAIDNYVVPSLKLDDGTFVFSYLATFLSFITPHDLPIELLRDAFHSKVSVLQLIFEALKVETGYIILIVIFFLVAVIPLGYALAWCCSKTILTDDNGNGINHESTQSLSDELTYEETLDCRKKVLGLFLQIIILVLIGSVIAMFVTNEQISTAIQQTPNVVRASLKDFEIFLKVTHKQITFVLFEGMNKAVGKISADLEDIDSLLGEPIQRELAFNTGLELIFESILDIITSSNNLAQRITTLLDTLERAVKLAQDSETRLEELHIQLTVLQRQCNYRDRPLCDTLKLKTLEEIGIIDRFTKLQDNAVLQKLLLMGDLEHENSLKNLSAELNTVRSVFKGYAAQLGKDSMPRKTEILRQLKLMNDGIHLSSRTLTITFKNLLEKIDSVWISVEPFLTGFNDFGFVIWNFGLGAALLTLIIALIFMGAFSCSCCHADNYAAITLVFGAVMICLSSVVLALFVMFQMLLGGHAEVFICRPFYEQPEYTVLGRLLDHPGIIYSAELENGIINEVLQLPDQTNSIPIVNVSLPHALQECELNKSAFTTFQLDGLINVSHSLNYQNYADLTREIDKIGASETSFLSITQSIQMNLEDMMYESDINLTKYRFELNQISPEKDMITFIDQMQRVSLQIQDVATSSRMTTLGSRATRLQSTLLEPLEQLKTDIVYHLTALELQIHPWLAQVNRSLSHLKKAQTFFDSDAGTVCFNQSALFRSRLRLHLDSYKDESIRSLNENCSLCRPLFDVFNGIRSMFCRNILDPINGLWFSGFLCLLSWSFATPIAFILASTYRQIEKLNKSLRHSNTVRYGAPAPEEVRTIEAEQRWSRPQVAPARAPEIDRPLDILSTPASIRIGSEFIILAYEDNSGVEPYYRESLI